MAGRIYAMLPAHAGEAFQFIRRRAKKWEQVGSGVATEAGDVVVFVPGTEVAVFEIPLPARRESDARRAAGFAIEDNIAQPIKSVHVALGLREESGSMREVHICSKRLMGDWIAQIGAAGLKHAQLVSDTSVLPSFPVLLDLGDRVLTSLRQQRFAMDASLPDDAKRAIIGDDALQIYGKDLAARLGGQAVQTDASPLETLAEWAEAKSSLLDLRQGEYAPRRAGVGKLSDWKRAAALAAVAGLALTGLTIAETRTLDQLSTQMENKAREIYSAANSGAPAPRNLIQAVQASGGAGQSQLDFRSASALLYKGVMQIDGLSIRSLRYDRRSGTLRASLVYAAYGDELKLKSLIESAGLSVRIGDTRREGNIVTGDIVLEPGQ